MPAAACYAIVLAGGKGERFWPLSTTARPKQFLSLVGGRTLFARALDRLGGVVPRKNICVVTNAEYAGLVRREAPDLPSANVLGEPVGRDTAAAIALGTAWVRKRDPQAAVVVQTADHVIGDLPVFRRTIRDALGLAGRKNVLITIGIRPTEAATAYGYIELGRSAVRGLSGTRFLRGKRFVEKPDARTARAYVSSGRYAWNSGMFVWSVPAITEAFAAHRPVLARMMKRLEPVLGTRRFAGALRNAYRGLEKISIDYAVMEKADNLLVARGEFAWDDVGSWTALSGHFAADASGNVLIGDAAQLDARGNVVLSGDRLTALIGVCDMVVVQAEGATLVCPKDRAQDVKKLVQRLKAGGRHDRLL